MRILLDNMLRLCSMNVLKRSLPANNRQLLVQQAPLVAHVARAGDDLLIRRNSEFCLVGKKGLEPLVDEAGVRESAEHSFVDMYPVFPTIDLVDEHVYVKGESTFGLAKGSGCGYEHVHTICHVNEDELSDEANTARMVMFAFGAAIAQSKMLRDANVSGWAIQCRIKHFMWSGTIGNTLFKKKFCGLVLNCLNVILHKAG